MIRSSFGFRVDREVFGGDPPKREVETLDDGRIRVPFKVSILHKEMKSLREWLAEQDIQYEFVQTVHHFKDEDMGFGSPRTVEGSRGFPFVLLNSQRDVFLFMIRWR